MILKICYYFETIPTAHGRRRKSVQFQALGDFGQNGSVTELKFFEIFMFLGLAI
jgi:hypothetical protein